MRDATPKAIKELVELATHAKDERVRAVDIPSEQLAVSGLPKPPAGAVIRRIDVIIRVDRDPARAAD